jgi:hypothetical protein
MESESRKSIPRILPAILNPIDNGFPQSLKASLEKIQIERHPFAQLRGRSNDTPPSDKKKKKKSKSKKQNRYFFFSKSKLIAITKIKKLSLIERGKKQKKKQEKKRKPIELILRNKH